MGGANFSICCEIASWPMLLALSLLMAVRIFPSVVGLKLNSVMPCVGFDFFVTVVYKSCLSQLGLSEGEGLLWCQSAC